MVLPLSLSLNSFHISPMSAVTITLIIAASLLSGILVWLAQRYASANKLAVFNERLQQQSQLLEQVQAEKPKLQSETQQSTHQLAVAGGRLQLLEEQYRLYQHQQKENQFLQNQLAQFKAKFQSAE